MGGKIVQEKLVGKYVTLREVTVEDVEFILSLRCDAKKSRFLHKTDYNIEEQKNYLKHYFDIKNEWYFISLNKLGKRIGTYRIYDIQKNSFCIGSWLMIEGVKPEESFETDYLVRMYGFDVLGFDKIHFDVRKENKKVWRYHEMFGAVRTGETSLDYLFECNKEDYINKTSSMRKIFGIE